MSELMTVFVRVRLRDNQINERHIQITAPLLHDLEIALIENANVREFDIYQRRGRHHKSYTEDFDIGAMLPALTALVSGQHDSSLKGILDNATDAPPEGDSVCMTT